MQGPGGLCRSAHRPPGLSPGLTTFVGANGARKTAVMQAIKQRWQEVHSAGTDTTPLFRPVGLRFQEFIRMVEVVFHRDESGRTRALDAPTRENSLGSRAPPPAGGCAFARWPVMIPRTTRCKTLDLTDTGNATT